MQHLNFLLISEYFEYLQGFSLFMGDCWCNILGTFDAFDAANSNCENSILPLEVHLLPLFSGSVYFQELWLKYGNCQGCSSR